MCKQRSQIAPGLPRLAAARGRTAQLELTRCPVRAGARPGRRSQLCPSASSNFSEAGRGRHGQSAHSPLAVRSQSARREISSCQRAARSLEHICASRGVRYERTCGSAERLDRCWGSLRESQTTAGSSRREDRVEQREQAACQPGVAVCALASLQASQGALTDPLTPWSRACAEHGGSRSGSSSCSWKLRHLIRALSGPSFQVCAAADEENLFEPERTKKAREKRQAKARIACSIGRHPSTAPENADRAEAGVEVLTAPPPTRHLPSPTSGEGDGSSRG